MFTRAVFKHLDILKYVFALSLIYNLNYDMENAHFSIFKFHLPIWLKQSNIALILEQTIEGNLTKREKKQTL